MRTSLALAVILALFGAAPGSASTGERVKRVQRSRSDLPTHRFHVLTKRLAARLSPGARGNLGAMARYGGGTGTIIFTHVVDGQRRGLLLTNHHVGGGTKFEAGRHVTLAGGQIGKAVRLLGESPEIDYALIEVELPDGAAIQPPRIGTGAKKGTTVYSLSAKSVLHGQVVRGAVHIGDRHLVDFLTPLPSKDGSRPPKRNAATIQMGIVKSDDPNRVSYTSGHLKLGSRPSTLPSAPGGSGSGVYSAADHTLVGVVFGGKPGPRYMGTTKISQDNETSFAPIDLVLAHAQQSGNNEGGILGAFWRSLGR